jgi:hypothetical protein
MKTKFTKPILIIILIFIIFDFIVFPGLTASDTIQNILGLLVGIFTILSGYQLIEWENLFQSSSNDIETIKPGETELDYIPKEEILKKKRTHKKKVEAHVIHPKVEKVTGEHQLDNNEKVRKSLTKKQTRFDQVGPK